MAEMPRAENFQQVQVHEQGAATPAKPRSVARRSAVAAALMLGAAAIGYYGYDYWTTGQYLQSTDDAYVKADYTTIAPKVSGYIADVLVADNQTVKAGAVLAHIDDRDFRTALAQAQADVKASEAAVRNLDAQLTLQNSIIDQAKATVAATQASLTFAQADADRYHELTKTGLGTVQRAQQTESIKSQTTAQLQRDQAARVSVEAKVVVLTTEREQAVAQRDRAQAVAHQAELNLSYTTISAPVDGTVGARSIRVGQFVTAGTQLMAVVPLHATYVVANFKETQLTYIRDGQPVEVSVDGFPGVSLKGHVDSLSPASGLEFSLLPPDNATGNFTKIVQRVPVKIVLDPWDLQGFLRPGMSVEPTIDTRAAAQHESPAIVAASSSPRG
ncbi:MAG: HlyD family secretion protein [Hyphomicrobium sp.]|uniref:HlyD family secretion protein n=1 Tax=Hyphomicrobium sp. TaxID=82 RepID=UPI0035645A39